MKQCVNGKMIEFEYTPSEIAEMEAERRRYELMEKSRPLTVDEVYRMVITQQINSLDVDDNTALRMTEFYPEWEEGKAYTVGFKVQRNGMLWKCGQAHTSVIGWEPENVASLWEQIDETHAGTMDDPIPYNGNMVLENGKYYVQDYMIYLCNRDSVSPVYNSLEDLLGLYVEIV